MLYVIGLETEIIISYRICFQNWNLEVIWLSIFCLVIFNCLLKIKRCFKEVFQSFSRFSVPPPPNISWHGQHIFHSVMLEKIFQNSKWNWCVKSACQAFSDSGGLMLWVLFSHGFLFCIAVDSLLSIIQVKANLGKNYLFPLSRSITNTAAFPSSHKS